MGNKKQSSALGVRAASHPYQLHGGVILVPAPQHHAHFTSRQGGKEKRRKCRAPNQSCWLQNSVGISRLDKTTAYSMQDTCDLIKVAGTDSAELS